MPKLSLFAHCLIVFTLTACASKPSQDTSPEKVTTKAYHNFYQQWQGVPYRLGGNNKAGIDCSAFVQQAFLELHQMPLPRTTHEQTQVGKRIEYENARQGDLVFFKTGRELRHVGIYLQGNQFLHASTSQGVIISRLDNPYWAGRFWHFRRVTDVDD
ncbi:NlpC/P60 family protein [Vibrio sp. WXL103]|uniref:NlpC/P60 family protein n=1 Tax=Vibrio sp. WXL103 TaxID=3450710 RepID=UPI003EC8BCEA